MKFVDVLYKGFACSKEKTTSIPLILFSIILFVRLHMEDLLEGPLLHLINESDFVFLFAAPLDVSVVAVRSVAPFGCGLTFFFVFGVAYY